MSRSRQTDRDGFAVAPTVIDRSTIKLEVFDNYHVNDWKVLPVVNCASFACTWTERRWVIDGPQWFQHWWMSLNYWYKKPWELPDWPRAVEEYMQGLAPN